MTSIDDMSDIEHLDDSFPKPHESSVLGHLARRRAELLEKHTTDLQVPTWTDPEFFVRYKPVPHKVISKLPATQDVRADKRAAAEIKAAIEILHAGCVGVYAKLDGKETKYSMRIGDEDGEWTKFDPDLAAALGSGDSVTEVVKTLYLTEGDIISAAGALSEFSGYRETSAEEDVEGE